ncbi:MULTISPECIES: hypothetical protein [unclassified Photobacterium]|uniref:hypothetical protein n=1 Tax=unclassified Photobacterium TaxID=2628852 RepID=UPI000D177C5A|nr:MULTISPECIES: hypothetical protein [unclassified Photobacterium]PSV26168.1 hypothetical protein C9J42_12725 [Photobacterium sp. GB-56]PSV30795.1 hypothetical protein C9J40_10735 [Photobacterium sp. GB-72]PSV37648.1 hypothetical protein C9J38_10185 [Photobacterium sp. GB-210]PSV45010.1 hypothetical protein C9J46_08020 [Photobacterium sp. GB-36]PSV55947.1 hypothetical protein C9J43_13630 [Photobacterium sp. GB-3]
MKLYLLFFVLLSSPSAYSFNNHSPITTFEAKTALTFDSSNCNTLLQLSFFHAGLCANKALNNFQPLSLKPTSSHYQEANIAISFDSDTRLYITSYSENDAYGFHLHIPLNIFSR